MIEYGSLGSVNTFAEYTGQDPTSPRVLARYTAALTMGHVLGRETEKSPDTITIACFVKSIETSGETFIAQHRDKAGEFQDIPYPIDTESAVDEADLPFFTEGAMFWMTQKRVNDLEVDGRSHPQHELEFSFLHSEI